MYQYRDYITIKDVNELRKSVKWKTFEAKQISTMLKNSLAIISVYDYDKCIAMARLIGDGTYDFIVDVIVHPNYQRQGIGHDMIEQLLHLAYDMMESRASVCLIAAKGKESFYENCGFHKIPDDFSESGMQIFLTR